MQLAKGRFARGERKRKVESSKGRPDAFGVRSILDIHHLEIEFNLPVGIQPLAAAAVRPRIASHWTGKDEREGERERERERG